MAMVKYTIKTVIRDRKQGAKMNYWTMELEGNLEVDLGVELQTDLHPSGRPDGEEVVSLEISSIRLYDVEIELEHLPAELIEVIMSEAVANGALENLNQFH